MTWDDRMTKIDFVSVLSRHLEDYTSRGLATLVPNFMMETEEIGTLLEESDAVDSYVDALIFLESIVESESTFHVQDWTIEYDFVRDAWIFSKKLDFKRIVIDSHNRKQIVKQKLVHKIANIGGREFERLLIYLFESLPGVESLFVQPQSYDGGFEFTAIFTDLLTRTPEWLLIQAKQQKHAVSVAQVRELIGTLSVESNKHRERKYRGVMISSKPASPKAKEAARDAFHNVDFLTHGDIVDLMIENNIGWSNEMLEFWTLDEQFWDELGGNVD